ncbi:hypothetical protein BKI52_26185 [marine bacterium AO1-C]|nr:hypothetical protein BKI52_26185 [marine bacterium AO1-C]
MFYFLLLNLCYMSRLTKDDWLNEGFRILQEFAQNKIRILYLCERLKVTRGSFYHHFKSIDDYILTLLKKWEKDNTIALIQTANKVTQGEEQAQVLGKMVVSINKSIEVAIRSWSHYNSIVKEYLDKVDKIRLSYLESIGEKLGLSPEQATKRAQFEYALLVGMQHLFPHMDEASMLALFTVNRE